MKKSTSDTVIKVGAGVVLGFVLAGIGKAASNSKSKNSLKDMMSRMKVQVQTYRTNQFIRRTANELINNIEYRDIITRVRSIYAHVQKVFNYLDDPYGLDYAASPIETQLVKGGDCDCLSVYLATLLVSSGHATQFVFVPGHVFVRVFIPAYQEKQINGMLYWKDEQGVDSHKTLKGFWVPIESTAKGIDIGVLSNKHIAFVKANRALVLDLK